jgi:hypothetical protein
MVKLFRLAQLMVEYLLHVQARAHAGQHAALLRVLRVRAHALKRGAEASLRVLTRARRGWGAQETLAGHKVELQSAAVEAVRSAEAREACACLAPRPRGAERTQNTRARMHACFCCAARAERMACASARAARERCAYAARAAHAQRTQHARAHTHAQRTHPLTDTPPSSPHPPPLPLLLSSRAAPHTAHRPAPSRRRCTRRRRAQSVTWHAKHAKSCARHAKPSERTQNTLPLPLSLTHACFLSRIRFLACSPCAVCLLDAWRCVRCAQLRDAGGDPRRCAHRRAAAARSRWRAHTHRGALKCANDARLLAVSLR